MNQLEIEMAIGKVLWYVGVGLFGLWLGRKTYNRFWKKPQEHKPSLEAVE
jgi:hypothetical protein